MIIHPGLHLLLERRFQSGGNEYLGLGADRAGSFVRSLLTLANLPIARVSPQWIATRIIPLIVGLAAAGLALVQSRRSEHTELYTESPYSKGRVLIFASLVLVLPLMLTASLVRYWSPYYACLPAIGSSLIAAALLKDLSVSRLVPSVFTFLVLGVISRGAEVDPSITTERNLERTSGALHQVEAGFKRLYPSLERGSVAYVFSQAHGIEGVYAHMYRFQALRVWYDDPLLLTAKPQMRRTERRKEYLFWVAPNLDVVEIDPISFRARSSGPTRPSYLQYGKTLRAYALGLAASGQTIRAAQILTSMPEPNASLWSLDARIAAMLLLANGKTEIAQGILSRVQPLSREGALGTINALLAESPPNLNLDEAAFAAFGIPQDDSEAMRSLMRWFITYGYDSQALRFAARLCRLYPEDSESVALIRSLEQKEKRDLITTRAISDPD